MSPSFDCHRELLGTSIERHPIPEEDFPLLSLRDRMTTAGMGGVLPEQPHPTQFQHILDVGCGTGDWMIEVAAITAPTTRLRGIDRSERIVAYARSHAATQGIKDRVQFQVMDVMSRLDFSPETFDLINQRLGSSYLRTWDWFGFLGRLKHITMPDGIIRLVEMENMESTSPALTRLADLFQQALFHSGHAFSQKGEILESELVRLLSRIGMKDIQTRSCTLEYCAGTLEGEFYAKDIKQALLMFRSFVLKWMRTSDYDQLCQQALEDLQRADFRGAKKLLTVWGKKK